MRITTKKALSLFCAMAWLLAGLPSRAATDSEVPAGTRFLVELRDKLEAKKIHAGRHFEARTLEALPTLDGRVIEAGARLKGRVSYVEHNKMELQFEEIDTGHGWVPIVATVTGVEGDKHVKAKTNEEGEISAKGSRGKDAAIGALVGGGLGAAVGAAAGGGKGAAIGAGAGGAGGALLGSASGGRDLVLQKGTRLEVSLERPLTFRSH
jgi:hypothetical protein